jgi:hypothetical protein
LSGTSFLLWLAAVRRSGSTFDLLFEIGQRRNPGILELADLALDDIAERNGIEIVQFLPALPVDGDEIG